MGKRYYDNYDYEEAYKEQCKKLEEAEMERWMKEGWVNCLYRTSTYKSTNTESNTTLLESMVYPSFKFKADVPKTEKKRETSPSQSNLNDKNARRYLIRLANINFGKGDIWATFGWNNGLLPETYEDAKKDVVNFIRRINRINLPSRMFSREECRGCKNFNPGREERIINEILSEHPEKREIKQAIINLSCGQTGNKKIESMEDTLEIINATLGGMVKGNELTVEQSAAVLTVAMKAYEVGKKARIKA